jgi:hypothetical protein
MHSAVTQSRIGAGGLEGPEIFNAVEQELVAIQVIDVHTHLFMPSFGQLGLSGIDHLITYHYLEAELFRFSKITPAEYWTLSLTQKADLIWRTLFLENTPVSEAARGVVAVLHAFGLPLDTPDLTEARRFFAGKDLQSHIDQVFEMSGVGEVVMTNDPFASEEAQLWEEGLVRDPRFHPALRLDHLLAAPLSPVEARHFLQKWCERMEPVYMAVSLSDSFQFPEESVFGHLLSEAVLPLCRELGIPLSLMIGVRRQVNPALRLAGDASGRADLSALERLCNAFPDNRFLVSVLSRENQHELCVYARKFSNLMPFGCWWFLNNPSIVGEITAERLEMLGNSFIPQHSDARVLEQLIYKWRNTRRTLAPILADRYKLLSGDGRRITREDIRRDVDRLLRTNFQQFVS